jgi:uncharacterized protein (AIM24 family)
MLNQPHITPSDTPSDVTSAPPARQQKIVVIESASNGGLKIEVLAYNTLSGSNDPRTAQTVYFANQTGLKLKQVRLTLQQSEVIVEAGALHYMHGHIDLQNPVGGMGGIGKAMFRKMLTNETAFIPRYRGSGQIYLEPSFGDFLIYKLRNEELIADRGLFYCGEASLDVGIAMQKNVSSALLGGEGLFQTQIRGSGIVVLELPVPADEVRCVHLNNETLKVDGSFALMRSGNIEFSVEKSSKGIFGSLASGEGLLQTFRGTGRVWLAPTQSIYQRMSLGGLSGISAAQHSSNTST